MAPLKPTSYFNLISLESVACFRTDEIFLENSITFSNVRKVVVKIFKKIFENCFTKVFSPKCYLPKPFVRNVVAQTGNLHRVLCHLENELSLSKWDVSQYPRTSKSKCYFPERLEYQLMFEENFYREWL